MLRHAIPAIGGLAVTSQSSLAPSSTRAASSHSRGKPKPTEQVEIAQARLWLKKLTPETIPTRISKDVTMKDKHSSKHMQRTPLSQLLPLIPKPMHEAVRKHRYYSASSDDLIITSTEQNKRSVCSKKLYAMLCEVGKEAVQPDRPTPDEPRKANPFLDSHIMNKTMSKSEMKRHVSETRSTQRKEKLKANVEQQIKAKELFHRQQREAGSGRRG